jgi:hypothetical protein
MFYIMMLVNDWMVSIGNSFVVGLLESYMVQFRFDLDVCIWTNIK